MVGLVKRPPAALAPGKGLMRKDQFQVSYVTNDMDRACETFGKGYGIKEFRFLEGPLPAGGHIKVAFAWVGGTLYEIIQASGPETAFYNNRLPSGEFAIRFHHLGFLIHDREAWRALEKEFEDNNLTIVSKTLGSGFMDAYYVVAPELDHYLEYIFPEQPGIDFFEGIPMNG